MGRVVLNAKGKRGFLDASPALWLIPGEQFVDDDLLALHRDTEAFKSVVGSGIVELDEIQEVQETEEAEEVEETQEVETEKEEGVLRFGDEEEEEHLIEDLKSMNVRDAAILILDTDDMETLNRWLAEEDRATVIRAIERRMNAI
jgi:hypothetical protein